MRDEIGTWVTVVLLCAGIAALDKYIEWQTRRAMRKAVR